MENALDALRAYARSGIPNRDEHLIRPLRLGADLQLAQGDAALTHCLDRVQDQVKYHLLQLGPIRVHSGQAFGKLRLYRDAVLRGFTPRKLDHLANRFIHVQWLHPRRRLLYEVTNSADDVARPVTVV